MNSKPLELLAPAGDRDAALAALQYGADAVYLGLKQFSARAEASNFTSDELGEITAYAHAQEPRRRVFAAVNTVVLERELPDLVAALDVLSQAGVDAVIVQDLGVARLARLHFPRLTLHASTQLAVHNAAGAETLRQLGFRRVTLARELTVEEVRTITSRVNIETEVFIHGALCYCYSGLCLFSSHLRGRSGNRGRCAYPCRELFATAPGGAGGGKRESGFAFSMKDLALPDQLEALRAAGVASLKIEGRKKSALYVAAAADFYRALLDGRLSPAQQAAGEADLQTIFSRPWTTLYAKSPRHCDVVDRDTVGHRGTPIGEVESVQRPAGGPACLRFRTERPLQRHDGLQIDIPGEGRPFGFPVDVLRVGGRNVFEAPAGSVVEVDLPRERPEIPRGAAVYCSSSQAVKQRYPLQRPKAGAFRIRQPMDVRLDLAAGALRATAVLRPEGALPLEVRRELAGAFPPATDPAKLVAAARESFQKLGDTPFQLARFELANPEGRFAPVSLLNQLRREACAGLEKELQLAAAARVAAIQAAVGAAAPPAAPAAAGVRWIVRVDDAASLDAFEAADWADVEEVIVAAELPPLPALQEQLAKLAAAAGRDRIRLALPVITRRWEEADLMDRIRTLRKAGWDRWEAANVSAWSFLRFHLPDPEQAGALDIASDWSVYATNRPAAAQLFQMGARRITLSPEDGFDNQSLLLPALGDRAAVTVYQDTPLFISESCPAANLSGQCPGPQHCQFVRMDIRSQAGEEVTVVNRHCRSFTIGREPFCLSGQIPRLTAAGARRLRVDFIIRPYAADEARRIWREVRAGRPLPGTHSGNFERGME